MKRPTKPGIERLESRDVPTTASLAGGVLTVVGTNAAEVITLRQTPAAITVSGVAQSFPSAAVSSIAVYGLGGDDMIDLRGVAKPMAINGGLGADRFLIDLTSPVTLPGYEQADRLEFGNPSQVIKSAVRGDGTLFALGADGGLYVNGLRDLLGISNFAIAPNGRIYVLQMNGVFMASDNGHSPFYTLIDTGVRSFSVASTGRVYALKSNGLFMYSDSGWAPNYSTIDSGVASFSIAPSGRVYALKSNGIFMASDDGRAPNYWQIDTGVSSFSVAPGGRVYVLKSNGVFMASDSGYPGYYSLIDNGVASFALAPTGRVYALKSNGVFMFSDNGWAPNYSLINNGVARFTLTPSGRVYALKSNGLFMASDDGRAPNYWQVDSGLGSFVTDGLTVESLVMASGSTLFVQGTSSNDTIRLSQGGGLIYVDINGVRRASVPSAGITLVRVNGFAGDDTVDATGMQTRVELYGGDGNDNLYGGSGADLLNGGAGNDGLWGGGTRDTLIGGPGADRFLLTENWLISLLRGQLPDFNQSQDVAVQFLSGNRPWVPPEVVQVDAGLARLEQRTNNARLLKLANGGFLTFERDGVLTKPDGSTPFADNNNTGRIRIADLTFSSNQNLTPAWAVVIHEVGHNWDEPDENGSVGAFRALSGWAVSPRTFQWTHSPGAQFVSTYAATNPFEDFAETLAATFLSNSVWMPQNAPAKVSLINAWLDSLRS
jgi:Ca2+-binding RTX toxin-like protein